MGLTNEEIVYEKMVKARVVRGRYQTAKDFCDRKLFDEAVSHIADEIYSRSIKSVTIVMHIDTQSIPTIEYTFEEMILPKMEGGEK